MTMNHKCSPRSLIRVALVAAIVLSVAAPLFSQTLTEDDAWKLGWPMLHGPDGNFIVPKCDIELVGHLRDARKVWESEYDDIGIGKCGVRPLGVVRELGNPHAHQGGFSTPIVADGTVFVAHYRPGGKVRFQGEGRSATFAPEACTVAADDVVAAIDAETGKTRWVAVQAGKGLNIQMGKRGGWGPTPVCHHGRLFAVGTTGRLYALDAKTGKLLWESNVGPGHEAMEKAKAESLEQRSMPKSPVAWDCSPIVAADTLVVPEYGGRDLGLRGVSTRDGKLLWQVPSVTASTATPAVVTLDRRQYVLCATNAGTLSLIDPHDGTMLWNVEGLGPNRRTLTPSDDYVIVNVRNGKAEKGQCGRLAAYRLTTHGATRVWEMPDKPEFGDHWWPDAGAHRHSLLRDGVAHLFFRKNDEAGTPSSHVVVRLTDGKILSHRPTEQHMTLPYLVEDRLLFFGDLCHHPAWGRWWLVPERLAADAPLPEETAFEHLLTSGYEVELEFPIVAGRIFMRTIEGRIACYDLRDTPELKRARAELKRIASLSTEEAVEALAELSRNPNAKTRRMAVEALAEHGTSAVDAVPALVERLGDDAAEVRSAAVATLVGIGEPATAALIEAACGSSEAATPAVLALARIETQQPLRSDLVPPLIVLLGEAEYEDAYKAAALLARIGQPALPALVSLVNEQRQPVSGRAAWAIGQMGTVAQPAIGDLEKAAKQTSDDRLRAAILEAVKSIKEGKPSL